MAVKKGNNASAPMSSDEVLKLIKIILVVVVISVVFYGITVLVLKYKKSDLNYIGESTPAIIQYEEIILGTLLNQNESEYYVLIKHEDDPYNTLFESYLKTYKSKEGALTVYKSNIDSVFNQYYVSDNSNLNVSNVTDLKISDVSLVKIKDKKVVESYEGIDNIETTLKELTK